MRWGSGDREARMIWIVELGALREGVVRLGRRSFISLATYERIAWTG